MYSVRKIFEKDAPLLRAIAKKCFPLDVHTQYTYWVVARYYGDKGFVLEYNGQPIGYIMTIESSNVTFIWQIGILSEYRNHGLSYQLIDAVVRCAKSINNRMEVTIDESNISCYFAFYKYCIKNGFEFNRIGMTNICDLDDVEFYENEIIYTITFNNGNS